MRIDEVIRTCSNERVAHAAVSSIGRKFLSDVTERARAYGMSVGAFTELSLSRFLRHGDEGELRSVISAMSGSQEPVLAGVHRILCIMMAASWTSDDRKTRDRTPCITAQLCAMDFDKFRDLHA